MNEVSIPDNLVGSMIRWWYRPMEKLPAHKELVLVRHNDQVELAYFDSEKEVFHLRNGKKTFTREDDIEWMETLRSEWI